MIYAPAVANYIDLQLVDYEGLSTDICLFFGRSVDTRTCWRTG